MDKPDGLVVVPPGGEAAFLAPLPVRRLWGVGPRMELRLLQAGVRTIGDLARLAPEMLDRRLGSHGHDLLRLAQGIDERPVLAEPGEAKSLGQEHTFEVDTGERDELRRTLLRLADEVARRLRRHGLSARTVTLKYRDETFETHTRAQTLGTPTTSGEVLFRVAWRQLLGVHAGRRVRLLGIYASGFGGDRQLELFDVPAEREDRAQDAVAERFGSSAITRASLLPTARRRPTPEHDE